jgi:23S rRNA (pseudouridine1915-N3)-methyltransferase
MRVITVGDDKDEWISEGIAHFTRLLSRYSSIEMISVPPAWGRSQSREALKRQEAQSLAPYLDKGVSVALDDSAATLDSQGFAKFLERLQVTSGGTATFLIGGPYGLDPQLAASCNHRISLSRLTFSHQIVRLILLEQLFRGFSILHGTDYHK